ncbi:hypothetical protein E8E12_006343 [Didymella heteroderae]|uniref:Uncharacterized protein n=1 Tax=Didymella heteroderae TaxID=1769908 RepID=A0A9P5C3S4_9PLEO|nr:hypothetical protein E8E12_006343 [Didymella heteroderae]
MCKLLLKIGAELELVEETGSTALHLAFCGLPPSAEAIETLLRAGANPNHINDFGLSPIHQASYTASSSDMELLLAYGADIEATASRGLRAIEYAIEEKNYDAIATLLGHSVCINHHWKENSITYSRVIYRAARHGDITTLRLLSDAHPEDIAMDDVAEWNYWNWFNTRPEPIYGEGDPPELLRSAFKKLLDSVTPGAVDRVLITYIDLSVQRTPIPGAFPDDDFEASEDSGSEGGGSEDSDCELEDTEGGSEDL